jgi:hypothetical protein
VQIQYTSINHGDLSESRRLVWALSRRAILKRWRFLPIAAFGTPLLVWLEFRTLFGPDNQTTALIATYGLVVLITGILRPLYAVDRLARREIAKRRAPFVVTVDDERIVNDRGGTYDAVRWSAVSGVTENGNTFILLGADNARLTSLCARCAGPQQVAELRQFLVGRGLMSAAYKIKV